MQKYPAFCIISYLLLMATCFLKQLLIYNRLSLQKAFTVFVFDRGQSSGNCFIQTVEDTGLNMHFQTFLHTRKIVIKPTD